MPVSRQRLNVATDSIRDSSNEFAFQARLLRFPNALRGIAEGDSWFDYLPAWFEDPDKGDLINQLNRFKVNNRRYLNILRVAEAGDTLENMVFGNEVDRLGEPKKNQFLRTLELVKRYKPHFVLFSGGGNDVVGEGLDSFVNHALLRDELGTLREDYVDYIIHQVFSRVIKKFIEEIIEAKPDIQIFLHGYGYAIPDGRPVIGDPEFGFIGPWMAPTFARKRIDFVEGQEIITELINKFNRFLDDISQDYPDNVHYLNLLQVISPEDWANELHLTVTGYEKVAGVYTDKLLQIFPPS